jgi:ATP-binding cassette subfamily B multidrug efflux pump
MKQLSSLNKYFWKYRWYFLFGIIFVVLTNYFRILAPQITGYVVNTVVNTISNTATQHPSNNNYDWLVQITIHYFDALDFKTKILFTGIILLIIAVISGFFMFLMRQTIIVMSRHIEFDQKNEVFGHYQKLDTAFYKMHSTGDLMNRISEDVSRVRMYTGPAIMYFINLAAVIGFSIYFMLRSDVKLTLVALCPLPILALTIYFVNTIINKKSERIQALLSDLTTNAQESYSGIRVIKSFVQEKNMFSFFKSNSESYRSNALSLAKTEAIYFPSMALLIGLSTLLTILVGALDVVNHPGDPAYSVGKIAEFVLYIQMLTFPVSAIGWTASMTQRAVASQRRINEFLHLQPQIKNVPGAVDQLLQGNISFEKVNFTYPHTGIHAIKDFSLEVKKGEKVAIVGRTGSGKSTIAQLLLRMYDINDGKLSYDGTGIRELKTESLRSQMSYVPQDVFLFSDSIKNNIRFGDATATDADVFAAAKQANIYNEIEAFDEKFETMVGERGVTLSGGQKQRISIARALIKKPEIVIFDDCLSAVDARTEKTILVNLYEYLQDRTAIIITHRIFSLFNFDKIIVMDDGKIVEEGTHSALMARNGIYAEMYRKQQAGEGSETSGVSF